MILLGTILIVAHRISTIMDVDRILLMSNGEIIEDGSPETLIKKNGGFAALAREQGLI